MDKDIRNLERRAQMGDIDSERELEDLKERSGVDSIIPSDLFSSKKVIKPIDILKKQANKINELSNHKILAGLSTRILTINNQKLFRHIFGVSCLNDINLHSTIFEIEYPLTGFPVKFLNIIGNKEELEAKNHLEFKKLLKEIFHSEEARVLIQTYYETRLFLEKDKK